MSTSAPPRRQFAVFDTHCHLHDSRFTQQACSKEATVSNQKLPQLLTNVLRRADAANVTHTVSCACFEDDWDTLEALMTQLQDVTSIKIIPSFGIHPWWANLKGTDYVENLRTKLRQYPHASLGEIGLCKTARGKQVPLDIQQAVFQTQLKLAAELSRTCIIHCVGHYGKLLEIFQATQKAKQPLPPQIVLHSYSGSPDMIAAFLALKKSNKTKSTNQESSQDANNDINIFFSFNVKQLTNPRSEKARECCRQVPLASLLIETDAPDQPPSVEILEVAKEKDMFLDGNDGEEQELTSLLTEGINELAWVQVAYQKAAELHGMTSEEFAAKVFQNSMRAFGVSN